MVAALGEELGVGLAVKRRSSVMVSLGGGLCTGMYCRRNFLLRRVILLEPSMRTTYWSYWHISSSSSRIRTINRRPRLTVLVWDVKEPTHGSKRVGDVVPGVMVCITYSVLGRPVDPTILSNKMVYCVVAICA